MTPDVDSVQLIAEIVRDSAAMSDAALAGDFDEARFLADLVVRKAVALRLHEIVLAGARVIERLGPCDTHPVDGFGAAMLQLADELDRIGFDPL